MPVPRLNNTDDMLSFFSFIASHAARRGQNTTTTSGSNSSNTNEEYDKHRTSLNYGEIPFQTLSLALQRIKIKYKGLSWSATNFSAGTDVFYDLGSGTGKAVIAAALYHSSFQKISGIEILQKLHQVSVQVLTAYRNYVAATDTLNLAPVDTLLGDITEVPWYNDATVVFCNTLAFDGPLLCTLAELLSNLSSGCFLITSGRLNDANRLDHDFVLLECSFEEYSWGKSSLYIHQRK